MLNVDELLREHKKLWEAVKGHWFIITSQTSGVDYGHCLFCNEDAEGIKGVIACDHSNLCVVKLTERPYA